MSSMFSKNREKRPRSPSSESNSFVRNVKSRVSGLLPATITKWFSSPSSSANGSAATVEGSDSSTEDEGPDGLVCLPPPKRIRYSPGFTKFNSTETPASTSESTEPQPSLLYESIATSNHRNESSFGSAPFISAEDISRIEVVKLPRREKEFKVPHPPGPSVALKRKSLFESKGGVKDASKPCSDTTTQSSSSATKETKEYKPSFKPAYFGSPFYPGRTMYGGASSSTFINHPNIKQRKTATLREVQKNDEMVNMSLAARKVMDILENYSSPLSEAKRIPIMRKAKNTSILNTSGPPPRSRGYSYKTQELYVPSYISILQMKERSRVMESTKAARQIIASQSSTQNITYSPYDLEKTKGDSSNLDKDSTTKIKTRLTRPNRGEDPLEMPKIINMPTAVLQIDKNNLPKFSLATTHTASAPKLPMFDSYSSPSVGSQPTNTSMSQPLFTTSSINAQSSPKSDENNMFGSPSLKSLVSSNPKISTQTRKSNEFTFSNPVTISTDPLQNSDTPPKFKFGSPVDVANKHGKRLRMVTSTPTKPLPIPQSATGWKCSECWIVNKDDAEKCASCTTKRPPKGSAGPSKSKCSICKLADSQLIKDTCSNCEKTQLSKSAPLPLSTSADLTKWKCGDCWVDNNAIAEKCVCCGSRNPNNRAPALPAAKHTSKGFEADWKCEDCWILNKSSVEKCAACGGAKTGTKSEAASAPPPVFNSPFARPPDPKLSEIVKAQKDRWECPSCLVMNESNKSLCICCEMERPGQAKKIPSKPSFSFGTLSNTTFKFGIDPKVQESNLEKKKEEAKKEPSRKLEEPETNNNTVSNIPTFSFGTKPEDKQISVQKTEAPKTTFSFGIPKQSSDSASTAVTLSSVPSPVAATAPSPAPAPSSAATVAPAPALVPSIAASTLAPAPTSTPALVPNFGTKQCPPTEQEEKPQEVPKVDLTASEPQPFAGFFTTSKTTAEATQPFPTFITSKSLINEKKEAVPFSFGTSKIGNSGSENFKFESGGIKSGPMFGGPATSASFGSPQTVPTTTSAPTMMFKQPDKQPSPAVFPPSEPTPASSLFSSSRSQAAAPTSASVAPLFNFGNNATAPSTDKPKFNFSFGSNTTPAAQPFSSFKPPVFGQTETSHSAQPFGGISTLGGNTVAPGNGITDNTMSSTTMGGAERSTPMFGAPAQSDNLWGANNSNNSGNLFGNTSQKPAPFSFGAPNPFHAGQQPATGVASGAPSPAQQPLFGAQAQAAAGSGLFGNGPMFPAAPAQPNLFGGAAAAAPSPAIFAPAQPQPTFDPQQPQPQPQPQPAFNFGAPQPTGVFGFGSQGQQQQNQPQPGVYNFGGGMNMGAPGMAMGSPSMGVQFNMGSAPATNVRRVRKAVRRIPQR